MLDDYDRDRQVIEAASSLSRELWEAYSAFHAYTGDGLRDIAKRMGWSMARVARAMDDPMNLTIEQIAALFFHMNTDWEIVRLGAEETTDA